MVSQMFLLFWDTWQITERSFRRELPMKHYYLHCIVCFKAIVAQPVIPSPMKRNMKRTEKKMVLLQIKLQQ